MPLEKAVDMILKAIYLKRLDMVVGSWFYYLIPKIAFLSSSFNNLACNFKYKGQLKVMNKAK